ncbi:MAG: HAMP domain-containing protein, partial [Armatimonadota bacterium]
MRLKIRHLIMVMIVVFVLAPMLLMDWLLTRRAGDALMDNIKMDVQDTSGEVADDVGEYLERGELIVTRLANSPAFRLGRAERIEQVLDSIIRPFPFAVHACYVQGNDAVMCRPGGLLRVSAGDARETPWYTLATERDGFGWTRAYRTTDSGRPVIACAAPVVGSRDGGVVALELDLRALSEFVRRRRLEKRGTIFIVDEANRLVSHRRAEWLLQPAAEVMSNLSQEDLEGRNAAIVPAVARSGAPRATEPSRTAPRRRGGATRQTGRPRSGRRPVPGGRVLAWAPIEHLGWSVGAMVPLAEYRGMLRGLVVLGLSVAGLAFVCAVAFGAVLCRMIVRPIGELAEGTRRIADGDYDHRVHVPQRNELGELAGAFNSMAEQLDEHRRQERLTLIGRMASGVIHDLRTPMAIVRTSMPVLLRKDAPDDDKQELARIVNGAIDRMAGMTQDVLDYARSEAAGPTLEMIAVREFIDAVEEALRHDFGLSGLELRTRVEGDMALRVDRERLSRA